MLIAQLSDPHILPKGQQMHGRVDTARMLRDAVAHLNRLDPKPDLVLLSGDLTDTGDPDAYRHLREILADLTQPVYAIPGNHDRRAPFRAAFSDHAYLPKEGTFIQYIIEEHMLRIVALDSVEEGRTRGNLCNERLAWLDRTLAQRAATPTLVMMHHAPLLTGLPHIDSVSMDRVPAFEQVIARHSQVERILCGHVHRAIQLRFGGTVVCACPSTAHQVAVDLRPDGQDAYTFEPPGFQLHRWNGRTLFSYTLNVGCFEGPYPFH